MTATDTEYDTIIEKIRAWPDALRFALLHEVLRMLAAGSMVADQRPPRSRRSTLAHAIGLAAGEGPPPTDEQVKQWLEERRMEKFG